MAKAASVAEFLAGLPADQRKALERLRKQVLSAAPVATELINYGVPMFRVGGKNLVAMTAGKSHCSFLPMSPAVVKAHAKELAGFETATGTIRFKPDEPIPAAIVRKLVKARLKKIGGAASKPAKKAPRSRA